MADTPVFSAEQKNAFRAQKAQEILTKAQANADFSAEIDVPKQAPENPKSWVVIVPGRLSLPNGNIQTFYRGQIIDSPADYAVLKRLGLQMQAVG